MGMSLGGQLGVMYRVESVNNREKKQIFRQKMKTWFFLGVDLVVFAACIFSSFKMYDDWDTCHFNFNAWAIMMTIFSFVSLLLNIF